MDSKNVIEIAVRALDKKKAKEQMELLNKERLSKKRLFVTQLCFAVPSFVIRGIIRLKNRGLYE